METMQKDVFARFGRASAADTGAGDTACLYPSLWSPLSGAAAGMRRRLALVEPIKIDANKKRISLCEILRLRRVDLSTFSTPP